MSLELNCANCIDDGKGIKIPPENAKKYPEKIGVRDLKEYKARGGAMIEIPIETTKTVEKSDIEK